MNKDVTTLLKNSQVELFGAKCHLLTMRDTVDIIFRAINHQHKITHSVVNVAKIVTMQKNALLKKAVNTCDLINVDGMGLVWGGRLLGMAIPERVTGIDLMQALLKKAQEEKKRVFFLGATQTTLKLMLEKLKKTFPHLLIAGSQHGYFTASEESTVAHSIQAAKADILFVAMPSPQKELFIESYHTQIQVPFLMGVGGSFDVLAEKVKRAPSWMQKIGLEWFYRLYQEPKRMWKRYTVTNSIFLWMLLKSKWSAR